MENELAGNKTMLAEDHIWYWNSEEYPDGFDCDYDPNNLLTEEKLFGDYRKWYVNFRESVETAAKACGYNQQENLESFLLRQVRAMGGTLIKKTIHSWLKDDYWPDRSDHGRDNMFQLCFALNMTDKEARSFFCKVFMELPVQYRRKEECVYEFCLRTGRGFQDARRILEEIQNSDTTWSACEGAELQTAQIHDALNLIEDEDVLIQFIRSQPAKKSTTGINTVKLLFNDILKSGAYPQKVKSNESLFDELYGFSARKKDWKGYKFQFPKFLGQPFLVNYTQLRDLEKNPTYDSIRKLLILLTFYGVFGRERHSDPVYVEANPYDEFIDNANDALTHCGYAPLYPRNPYDWLFLHCASLEHPINELQAFANRYWLPKENKQKPEQGHV